MFRPTATGWWIGAAVLVLCGAGVAWGIGPWFFVAIGVGPAVVVALGRCRHTQTVWERRLPDGSRPVSAAPTAVFWTVCVSCGRALAPVNPRDGAAIPAAVGHYDAAKAVASIHRAQITARRRQRVAAKRATWLARPARPAKPAPPPLTLIEGRKAR
jgi:hypothetical protein